MAKHLNILAVAGTLLAAASVAVLADHTVAREDLAPGAEPKVFNVEQSSGTTRAAVHQARRTVGVMIQALRHPTSGQHDFQVKKPFRQGDAVEHLWLADVTFSGNRFHGYVDNVPRTIKGLKMGDRVSVNPNEISDWAYVDKGRLIGGYTIRLFYSQLAPRDKAAFEKETQFRIGTNP